MLGFIYGSIPMPVFLGRILPSLKIFIVSHPPYGFEHGEKNRVCCCERRVF